MRRSLLCSLALPALVLLFTLQARGELPAGAVWIDVRSPAEFAEGHLPGATLIPFDGIEKGVARLGLEKDRPVYLYCAVGGRAEVARTRLQAAGYTRVTNVGGLEDARALLARESRTD